MAWLKNAIIVMTTRTARMIQIKVRPRTVIIKATTAVIQIITILKTVTAAIATVVIVIRVIRPIGIQGNKNY